MLEIVLMSQLLGGQRERAVTPSGGSVCVREREKELGKSVRERERVCDRAYSYHISLSLTYLE